MRLNDEVLKFEITAQDKILSIKKEAEADFEARQLTSKGMMYGFLKSASFEDASMIGYFIKENSGTQVAELLTKFGGLKEKDLEKLKGDVLAEPPAMQESNFKAGISVADSLDFDPYHPKLGDRLRMQQALDSYDAVLSCKDVQFDAQGHLSDATACGPKNVPLMVDGVPTGAKLGR
jgi:hypothetical protein